MEIKPNVGVNELNPKKNKSKKTNLANKKSNPSIFRKGETSLIFIGAGLVTLFIFFLFFRPSTPVIDERANNNIFSNDFEQRLTKIEQIVDKLEEIIFNNNGASNSGSSIDLSSYVSKLEKTETTLTIKLDILTNRLDGVEEKLLFFIDGADKKSINKKESKSKKIVSLKKQPSPLKKETKVVKTKKIPPKPAPKIKQIKIITNKAQTKKNNKTSEKEKIVKKTVKKITKISKDPTAYYTVKKGDTLYSISKNNGLSVYELRKINNMSVDTPIHPGDKIIVKK